MDITVLLKGAALGFAVAAPLGPIGTLCIERVLRHGFSAGVAAGLGTALADAVYAYAGALGLITLVAAMGSLSNGLTLLGALFLLYLGVRSLRETATFSDKALPVMRWSKVFLTTFALTLANPATVFSFAAMFAGIGVKTDSSYLDTAFLTAGVLLGSMLWWIILSGATAIARGRMGRRTESIVRLASSLVLFVFGAVSLGVAVKGFWVS